MCGKTVKDKFRNERIRRFVRITLTNIRLEIVVWLYYVEITYNANIEVFRYTS